MINTIPDPKEMKKLAQATAEENKRLADKRNQDYINELLPEVIARIRFMAEVKGECEATFYVKNNTNAVEEVVANGLMVLLQKMSYDVSYHGRSHIITIRWD